jgi:hypothetical protein
MTINADIDRIFKEGLNDYSPKAPDYIWDQIDQNLNHRKKKMQLTLVFSIAASIAILIAFGAGFLITPGNHQPDVVNQHAIVAVDSTLINQGQTQEPVVIDNNKNLSIEEKAENKTETSKPTNVKDKNVEELSKPKATRVKSTGSLLPPSFGDSATMVNDTLPKTDTVK